MKDLTIFSIALAVLFVVGCADAAKPPMELSSLPESLGATQNAPDDAPRISLEDAKKEYDAGTAVIVDVRSEQAYNEEHIKGALHIPPEKLDQYLNKFPKGKKVIAYCS